MEADGNELLPHAKSAMMSIERHLQMQKNTIAETEAKLDELADKDKQRRAKWWRFWDQPDEVDFSIFCITSRICAKHYKALEHLSYNLDLMREVVKHCENGQEVKMNDDLLDILDSPALAATRDFRIL